MNHEIAPGLIFSNMQGDKETKSWLGEWLGFWPVGIIDI